MTLFQALSRLIFLALGAAASAAESPPQDLVSTPEIAGAAIPAGTNLQIHADFKNQAFASPTALTFDGGGDIFVTETRRFGHGVEDDRGHLYWFLDDLAARKTSDRLALHEKWREKVPLDYMTEKSDLVRRFTDSTGDGIYDKATVFAEGFNEVLDGPAAGIFDYEGTIYLACIPKLLMLRDTTGDGKADDRKTIEEGFGIRISLSGHDLNGFALGPDGRIYGTVGDRGFSLTTREGVVYDYPNQGAVFRFEPDGTSFEVVHTGLRNPKEIAFDDLGYAFTVDNNSDQGDKARIVYIVDGGDSGWEMEHQAMFSFHRQIGMDELPPSRWMDEKIWHLANPEQPAFIVPPIAHLSSGPSGLTYNPGTGFLENEAGRFLICDYRGTATKSGIWSFKMEPAGAGMRMADSRKILTGIAATDAEYSWDGRLFVTDFGGGWQAHDEGRLISLDAGENMWRARDAASTAKIMRAGFEQRSSAELVHLLRHPDSRVRLRSQLALTRKPDALKQFSNAILSSDGMTRIHGIWGLGILARRGSSPLPVTDFGDIPSQKLRRDAEAKLLTLIDDKQDEEIRCQALRALADASQGRPPLPLAPLLADPSPRIRYFATLLAGKRKSIGLFSSICEMLAENDNKDPLLRHAGAVALQNLWPEPKVVASLSTNPSAAVRLAAVVALRRMKSPGVADFIRDQDPQVADEAIRALCDLDMTNRALAAPLLDKLDSREWTPLMLRRLLHNSFHLGDAENAARVLAFASDPAQPEALRKEAFRLLSSWLKPFPVDQFTGHSRSLPDREPTVLLPLLTEKIPALLTRKDFTLAAALELIEQYELDIPTLDDAALRAIITSSDQPTAASAKALDLLTRNAPADLDSFLAEIIRSAPDEAALSALGHLAGISPTAVIAPLAAALESERPLLARNSWAILATITGDEADALFIRNLNLLLASQGISPNAIELLAAARTRKSPAIAAAIAAIEKSLAENPDPLARWNPSLQGGDPRTGAAIFNSHPAAECRRCHRLGDLHDDGGITAPDLAGIGSRHTNPRYFLESLIEPSAFVSPGFGVVAVDFRNGSSINGNLLADTTDHLDIEVEGKALRIRRDDIAEVTLPVSAMPPMGDLLEPAEVRDLVAWLTSLTQANAAPAPEIIPEPFDPNTLAPPEKTASAIDPAIMKSGRTQFITCSACHGQNGEGGPAGPPLAGSEWVNGPAENLIRIQLRGLQGPITVKGQTYNFPAGMTALAYQNDKQIAAVLTYVRNSFGNSAPPVTAAEVAALRNEVGKPPLTERDLIPPTTATPPATEKASTQSNGKYDDLTSDSSNTKWIVAAGVGLLALLSLIPLFRKKS